MASFSKMAFWPVGYFRPYTRWLLRERRNVASAIQLIGAEMDRIGFIKVTYDTEDDDGEIVVTEKRIGFSVPEGTSLARLCQAYIAQGGNPYDISSFMHPDMTEAHGVNEDGTVSTFNWYPKGGIVAPKSVNANSPVDDPDDTGYGAYQGGWLETDRYYPARLGGRIDRGVDDTDTIVQTMHQIRAWANQTIKERLQDIEWRIVKLSDCWEQLRLEREQTLLRAFGDSVGAMAGWYDSDKVVRTLLVQNLIQDMNDLLYETEGDGSVRAYRANQDKVGLLFFTFADVSSEIGRDPMGG